MLKVFKDFKDIATPIGPQVLAYSVLYFFLLSQVHVCAQHKRLGFIPIASIDGILTQTISGKSLLAVRIPGFALDIRWH